jgi:hypothetical protein
MAVTGCSDWLTTVTTNGDGLPIPVQLTMAVSPGDTMTLIVTKRGSASSGSHVGIGCVVVSDRYTGGAMVWRDMAAT